MADPSPAYRTGTDVMRAVVSGATMRQRPMPKMIDAGRKSMKYEIGGREVLAICGANFHGMLPAGTRTYHSTPSAMIAGPAAMKILGPNFSAKLPNRLVTRI